MRRHKKADKRRLKRPLAKKAERQRYHAALRRRKARRIAAFLRRLGVASGKAGEALRSLAVSIQTGTPPGIGV